MNCLLFYTACNLTSNCGFNQIEYIKADGVIYLETFDAKIVLREHEHFKTVNII